MGHKSSEVRKNLTPVSTSKQESSAESCKEFTMNTSDALTDFDQLNALVFPTLEDFNASSTGEALKWTVLVQDTVYQIVSTRTVDTQHGSFCLSRKLIDPAVLLGQVIC